jgi:hypothetical protein
MITTEPGTLFYPEAMFLLLQIIIIFIAFFLHIALIFEYFSLLVKVVVTLRLPKLSVAWP